VQNSAGEIDESFVKVHPREELLAFPPAKPRPSYSVADGDEVMKLLDRK
jgi:hypothetical protein